MRFKFKLLLLLPILLQVSACSSPDKISFRNSDYVFDTYYNDSFFLLDNSVVHEEIALASHAMALSTFNKNPDYSKRIEFAHELWLNERFENIWFNESMVEKPTTDSIGYGIASKHIALEGQDFNLIAVAVRGGYYEGEWANNVTIGEEGNAIGFDGASDTVIDGIMNYIDRYKLTGHTKLWISGFSRAAITSNLTAGKIIDKISNNLFLPGVVSMSNNDIYAYCFEPPMGLVMDFEEARSDKYHGIHNFINFNDPVPLVAPREWGFTRYGVDHYYPDRLTDIFFDATEREKMISLYHFTYGGEKFPKYSVDDWEFFDVGEEYAAPDNRPRESINPSQGRFCHALIETLAIYAFMNRQMYAAACQTGIRALLEAAMGLNPKIEKINFSNLIKVIFEYEFIQTLIYELLGDSSYEFAYDVSMLLYQIFGANEDNFKEIEELYNLNFYMFIFFGAGFQYRKDVLTQLLYRDNAMGIVIGHMPELSYAFLSSTDSRFLGDRACKFNDGSYYILHVNNPHSFKIYEKQLKKDIFEYKDDVMSSDCISAEKLADGSISIYLPKNGQYEYIGDFGDLALSDVDQTYGTRLVSENLPFSGQIN